MNILLAFILIHCTIIIHELAHYFCARLFNMPVTEVCIGRGIQLFSRKSRRTGTSFTLKLLPLSGYIRVLSTSVCFKRRCLKKAAFDNQALWKRIAVVLSGPAADLFTLLLFHTLFFFNRDCAITPALRFIVFFSYRTVLMNFIPIPGSDTARILMLLYIPFQKTWLFNKLQHILSHFRPSIKFQHRRRFL